MKEGALKTVPNKDDPEGYSHVADCLQYAALIVQGGLVPRLISYLFAPKRKPLAPKFSSAAWT
jgi:hypothetical protein